ncbi:sensor histidine kinase [Streptomyces bacillaris]|uniref:sensor histidine kinase n=1 Tax=Streptomyces bacillaris TaxID=68179 RepID=UPI0035DB3F2D
MVGTSTATGRWRPVLHDTALWAALSAAGFYAYTDRAAPSLALDLLLPLSVLTVAVPGSRRRPGAAVFAANALCAVGLAATPPAASPYLLALAALAYLLGVRGTDTGRALLLLGTCVAVDLAVCAVLAVDAVYWFYVLALVPLALLPPWLAGRHRQARLALVHGGWERARVLAEQQRSVAERAGLRERTRIAADVHDSLGHQLSLIALRAGALELSPTLSGQDRADLAGLRADVADAVGHLRETLTVLRADEEAPGTAPRGAFVDAPGTAPAAESVDALVRRAREAGVAAEVHREGEPPLRSPLITRTVHRVVQESLTNAVKHAPGAAVRIHLTHRADRTTVRVTNSPPPEGASPASPAAPPASGGGHGLTALRERVQLVGGTLRTGPYGDGGYEVCAVLPDAVGGRRPSDGPYAPQGPFPPHGPFAPHAPGPESGPHQDPGPLHGLADARRRTRRRFVVAFAVPAALGAVMLVSAALLAHQLTACVLRPADFAGLRTGRTSTELARVLPERQFPYVPDRVADDHPEPPGTVCAFYRSNGNLLEQVDIYRLCYADSRLVAKDVLPGTRRG